MHSPVVSYGIACCRKNNSTNRYEILMIKKKSTYSFSEFVCGAYDIYHKHTLKCMLNEMSIDEKISILSLNYDTIWFRMYGTFPTAPYSSYYNRGHKRFVSLISIDKNAYITNLIKSSNNAEIIWEIPKGRPDKYESYIETAVREFKEETNISKHEYIILFNEDKITYTFSDNGRRYMYVYYIAIMNNNNYIPQFSYTSKHMYREVTDIKFLSTDKIRAFNNTRLLKLAKLIINKSKKYIQ